MKRQQLKNIIEFEMGLYEELNSVEGRRSIYEEMDYVEEEEIELEG